MNDRILSFLGLCRRAKKLVIGAETAEKSVREGKSLLVLYASDAAPNSLKRVRRACGEQGVAVRQLHCDKQALSLALGRLSAVVSVEDRGFADRLCQMLDAESV